MIPASLCSFLLQTVAPTAQPKCFQAWDMYLTNIYYFQSETLPEYDSDGPCLPALSIWGCWWQTPIGAASASFCVNYTHVLVMRVIH